MSITTKVELYADRVQRRIASKKRRALFKQGAYLRTTMQRSMRYRKAASKPGDPPSAHRESGAQLRQRIRFDVDFGAESVACGPDVKPDSKVRSHKPLPQLLNEGGVMEGIGGEPVTIASRPFVDPVFSDGGKKFRQLIETEQL
jgi:hypothetical protein